MSWIKKLFSRNTKEDLINSLEEIYRGLKNDNTDKDEHWLLSNTWLLRYKNWNAPQTKKPKLMEYIAFKDTLQFALLDSPNSIRALSLFLVWKEFGDKEAEGGSAEFIRLMEPVEQAKRDHKIFEEYKRKNQFSFNKAMQENDFSLHGRSYYLMTVEYMDNHPETHQIAMDELERIEKNK